MKCEKDMKERLRNAVIFIEFQSFKDLYVYVTSNLEKKKKKKKRNSAYKGLSKVLEICTHSLPSQAWESFTVITLNKSSVTPPAAEPAQPGSPPGLSPGHVETSKAKGIGTPWASSAPRAVPRP